MRKPNPKIDPDAPASRVVGYWESASAFGRAIGRPPSTVQRWLEKGSIDAVYHPEIWAAAKREKKPLKSSDFLDHRVFAKPVQAEASATL